MRQTDDLQRQVDEAEKVTQEEQDAHAATQAELEEMKGRLQEMETALGNSNEEAAVTLAAATSDLTTQADQLKRVCS